MGDERFELFERSAGIAMIPATSILELGKPQALRFNQTP
jgi:hypothetical protein